MAMPLAVILSCRSVRWWRPVLFLNTLSAWWISGRLEVPEQQHRVRQVAHVESRSSPAYDQPVLGDDHVW